MQRLDRILAVIDPTVEIQDGVAKAARLARASGAALELFVCDFDPALSGEPFFDTDTLRRLRENSSPSGAPTWRSWRANCASAASRSRRTCTGTIRCTPASCAGSGSSRPTSSSRTRTTTRSLRRTLFSNTDWTLIRKCPVPLLLAKPRLGCAAPHPRGARSGPSRRQARGARQRHPRHGPVAGAGPAWLRRGRPRFLPGRAARGDDRHGRHAAGARTRWGRKSSTPNASGSRRPCSDWRPRTAWIRKRCTSCGAARSNCCRATRRRSATDFVVMGAVSRTRLQEIFIGSTAERVLDRLPCDVLVVKPGDFGERLPF